MSLCVKPSVFNDFVDFCITGKRNRTGAHAIKWENHWSDCNSLFIQQFTRSSFVHVKTLM